MATITQPQGHTRHLKIGTTLKNHSAKIGNYYYRSKNWTFCNSV